MIPFALPSRVIEPFALASLGVVGGCLLAHHGLRALRTVTAWRSIRPGALVPQAAGPVAARGRVALEGPLFAPLSGRPCAGFELEVVGQSVRLGHTVRQSRPFRLVNADVAARVVDDRMVLRTSVTAERVLQPGEAMPAGLQWLEDASVEMRWLRDRAMPLRLTERALFVDHEVVVLASARASNVVGSIQPVREEAIARAATGTDGRAWSGAAERAVASHEPALWLEPCASDAALEIVDATHPAPMPQASHWRTAMLPLGIVMAVWSFVGVLRVLSPWLEGWS